MWWFWGFLRYKWNIFLWLLCALCLSLWWTDNILFKLLTEKHQSDIQLCYHAMLQTFLQKKIIIIFLIRRMWNVNTYLLTSPEGVSIMHSKATRTCSQYFIIFQKLIFSSATLKIICWVKKNKNGIKHLQK